MNSAIKIILSLFLIFAGYAYAADTASILPLAKTQFTDSNGKPLTSGTVDFYIPSTTTRKATWQDAAETILNTNPVVLDGAGRGLILGSGSYRQVVKDRVGNVIWDQVTSSVGSGGGGSTVGDGNPVGTILPWSGFTVPSSSYVFTYGQELSRSTYPVLFTNLTLTQSATCVSGNATLTTVSDTSELNVGAAVEVSCMAAGSVIVSKTSSTVTLNNLALVSTTASAVFFPYGNGNGTTTFNVPDYRGVVLPGRCNMGGSNCSVISNPTYTDPNALYGVGGNQTNTLLLTNLPPITPTGTVNITDPGHHHTMGANISNTISVQGGGTFPAVPLVTNDDTGNSTTGITATFAGATGGGSSTAFRTIQPSKTINYIIKIVADAPSTGIGVVSIQGMDGVLLCGIGLSCTSQTISATGITVGTTPVLSGTTTNILYNNAGVVGEYALATALEYQAGTANRIVTASVIWPAETTTTYGTTTTFNFQTFKNTAVTLTGNITTQTLTNVVAGKAGMISFIQDGTGSRTTVWNSVFKFSGGTAPTLTTTAGAVDILSYSCRSATFCAASLLTDVK